MKDRTREALFNLLGGKLEGYVTFDLFAGSGTTLLAARSLNLRSIGVEQSPDYAALIRQELDAVTLNQLS